MDWNHFPPSILALSKAAGLVLSVTFGSINTVKYGVRTYHYFDGPTDITPAFAQESTVVQFSHESEPCPTCRFVDMDDRLLDYYGRPLDMGQLFAHDSSATGSTMPLTITFEAPSTPNSTSTSTTPSTPNAIPLFAPTTDTPFAEPNSLPPIFENILTWWLFPLQSILLNATNVAASGAWLIACRLAYAIFAKAVVACFHHLQKNRKIQHAKIASSKANAQLATGTNANTNAMLEKSTEIIHEYHQDPATMMAAMHRLLVDYVDGEESRRTEWLATMKRSLNGRYNARVNRHNASQAKRLEALNLQASQDLEKRKEEMETMYRRDIATSLNIDPSLNPTLRDAEAEFRCRLDGLNIGEGNKTAINRIARAVLYSFNYVLVVGEAKIGRRSLIGGQQDQMDLLRRELSREKKGREGSEDLVDDLCLEVTFLRKAIEEAKLPVADFYLYLARHKDKKGENGSHSGGREGSSLFSASVSAQIEGETPFGEGGNVMRESDPELEEVLAASEESNKEETARDADDKEEPHEGEVEGTDGIKDANEQNHHDLPQSADGERPNKNEVKEEIGIRYANEQTHYDAPQSNDGEHPNEDEVKEAIGIKDANEHTDHDTPQSDEGEKPNKDEVKEETDIKDANEQNHHDAPPINDETFPVPFHGRSDVESLNEGKEDGKTGIKDIAVQNGADASRIEDADSEETKDTAFARALQKKFDAESTADKVNWLEKQIAYLKAGHGDPEHPFAKLIPPSAPAIPTEDTGDAATARQFYEAELIWWRRNRILKYETELARLKEENADLEAVFGDDTGASSCAPSDNGDMGNGGIQAQPVTPGGAPLSPPQTEPQPTKTQKRNLERKRAKARKAEEAVSN